MGRQLSLDDALKLNYGILFDTCILISACDEPPRDPDYTTRLRKLIVQIDEAEARLSFKRKFTTELVRWEFLAPGISDATHKRRDGWFKARDIKISSEPPYGYVGVLEDLESDRVAPAGVKAVDAALAAYAIASYGDPSWSPKLAIATDNVKDFCWNDAVLVSDFFTTPRTC